MIGDDAWRDGAHRVEDGPIRASRGDDLGVLAEVALDGLLGAVVGDDLCGRGPLGGLVGEQGPLVEEILFQFGTGLLVDREAEAQLWRLLAAELVRSTRAIRRGAEMAVQRDRMAIGGWFLEAHSSDGR